MDPRLQKLGAMYWGRRAVFFLLSGLAAVSIAAPPPSLAPQPHTPLEKEKSVLPPRPHAETPGRIFAKGFADDNIYKKGACCDNICRFVSQLHDQKIDLSKARVLYILKQSDEEGLYPQRSRQGIAIWGFHVVLELDGKIYDYDHAEAEPVPAHDYS
jgi:hypothetical protein